MDTTTAAHMDADSDRLAVGWISRTVTISGEFGELRDITTDPITVTEAIVITGDRADVIATTEATIRTLREQEAEYRRAIDAGEYGDTEAERGELAYMVQATNDLAAELAEVADVA